MYMIDLPLDAAALTRFAWRQGHAGGRNPSDEDFGYAAHAWLAATLGEQAPRPFRLMETRAGLRLLGYAAADADTLAQITLHRTDPLTVYGWGIRVAGQRFYAPELALHTGGKVVAIFNPADMSAVTVVTQRGQFVCEAEATARAVHGRGVDALKQIQRYKKAARQRVDQHIADVMALSDEQELAEAVVATTKPRNPDAQIGDGGPRVTRLFQRHSAARQTAPTATGRGDAASDTVDFPTAAQAATDPERAARRRSARALHTLHEQEARLA